MRRVFNASEVPDSYKIRVYDALCAYFARSLPAYYTDGTPTDPRYDTGAVNTETEVFGLEVDDNDLYVNVAIKGWVDTHCFCVPLPELTREMDHGESTGIEVDHLRRVISAPRAAWQGSQVRGDTEHMDTPEAIASHFVLALSDLDDYDVVLDAIRTAIAATDRAAYERAAQVAEQHSLRCERRMVGADKHEQTSLLGGSAAGALIAAAIRALATAPAPAPTE